MTKLKELIARWNSDEGKPYKGSLIDMKSFEEGNLSCMCAQGQVLHVVGGWPADRLNSAQQFEADNETARLLNISRAHAILLRNTNDNLDGAPAIVLTDPSKVIGDQWSKLLDFWWHTDSMTNSDWLKVIAAGAAARNAAGAAARNAARDAAWEIQGAEIFKRDGRAFFFLPMFGFATPDDIPARPSDYGVVA